MASSVDTRIEQCNKDWGFLAERHLDRGVEGMLEKRYTETDPAK